ncbi:hypothetical protein Tco_0810663 [Tanacetum coccineum]
MFQVIKEPLPKALSDTAVIGHWLVVEGVQPAIPENPSVEGIYSLIELYWLFLIKFLLKLSYSCYHQTDEYLELYFSERDNRKESKEANNKKKSNHPCKRRILRVLCSVCFM